jgi:hypothetical protein
MSGNGVLGRVLICSHVRLPMLLETVGFHPRVCDSIFRVLDFAWAPHLRTPGTHAPGRRGAVVADGRDCPRGARARMRYGTTGGAPSGSATTRCRRLTNHDPAITSTKPTTVHTVMTSCNSSTPATMATAGFT